MKSFDNILTSLGFINTYYVRGVQSVDHLFSRRLSGIYILHFASGLYYVGQSNRIPRRYIEHLRNHNNIEYLSFKYVAQARLDQEERNVIYSLEAQGVPLRNIIHASLSYGSSRFDLIMPPEEQKAWLNGETVDVPSEDVFPRVEEQSNHRDKYKQLFIEFKEQNFSSEALNLCRLYVRNCIPAFRRAECSFWSISCLPITNKNSRLSCVSMNIMETFVLGRGGWSFINIAQATFLHHYINDREFYRLYPHTQIRYNTNYKAAGFNQMSIDIGDPETADSILRDDTILHAARLLNLALMRKQRTLYARFHCFDLADYIVI